MLDHVPKGLRTSCSVVIPLIKRSAGLCAEGQYFPQTEIAQIALTL